MMNKSKPDWQNKFRERGLRFTQPRRVILNVLVNTAEHLSAEEIYMRVHKKYPNIGLTTVYRNLYTLERMGIVTKFHFGDGCHRFELIESNKKPEHHHHLVCTGCKRIIDYDDFMNEEIDYIKKVEKALSRKHSFHITDHVIQFYGLCNKCKTA
jgi:Fur family transcriptional regulator, ferric uptake regulator